MLPGMESFWDSAKCVSWGFWAQCSSAYWDLIYKNGNGLEEGSQDGRKQGVPPGPP